MGGSFFINPYNNLIYIPDYEEEEVDVYSKTGSLIKQIKIPRASSDHPQLPHASPAFIAFTKNGMGIISLIGKGISGTRWRFIDSALDDLLVEPNQTHPHIYSEFNSFTLSRDKSKLYVLNNRKPIIKIFDGSENFKEININSLYPNGADASKIIQNKLEDKIFVSGAYNSQIISSDLSYTSHQASIGFLGDFCYNQNTPNSIYAFDDGANFKLLDFDNQRTVLSLPLDGRFNWIHRRGIVTTTNDKYVITYSDRVDYTTSTSQIVFFNTTMFK